MFVAFIATVAIMFGSASIGFEAGQANPDAKNILHATPAE